MTESKLRKLRRKHEITLQQVADAMGKSRMTVCRWEAGKIQNKEKILSEYKSALEGLIKPKS